MQITHVIHLAGLQVPTCRADPILGAKVNVLGTLAVFEAVRLAGDQVKRLVYASSAAVFGPPEKYPTGPLADDVPLVPATHYGVFKCCNEGNARIYFQDFGLSSIGLRPWTVYGVGRDLRHDQRADQGDQVGRPGPALPHHLRRLAGLAVRRRRGQGVRALPGSPVPRREDLQPSRRGRAICRRSTRLCATSSRAPAS